MRLTQTVLCNLPGIPQEISAATCRGEMLTFGDWVASANNETFEDNYCKVLDKPGCSQILLDKRGCKTLMLSSWFDFPG